MMFTRPNVHCEIRIAFVGASPCSVPPKAHCRGAAPRTSVEGFDKDDLRLAGLRRGRLGLRVADVTSNLTLSSPHASGRTVLARACTAASSDAQRSNTKSAGFMATILIHSIPLKPINLCASHGHVHPRGASLNRCPPDERYTDSCTCDPVHTQRKYRVRFGV